MEITYCDNCGSQIGPDELSTGRSKRTGEGKVYCSKCAPLFEYTSSSLLALQLPESIHDLPTGTAIPVVLEPPRSENSVTKFYFCETCGKRITDKQILEGLGRDKKLKGVFCKDCAVGVMTMEMDAINIGQLAKAKPRIPLSPASDQAEARQAPRKTSGIFRPHEAPQRNLPGKTPAGGKADRFPLLLAIGAVAVIGIVVAAVAMQQQAAPRGQVSQTQQSETVTKPPPAPDSIPSAPPVKTSPTSPTSQEQPRIASAPIVPAKKSDAPQDSPRNMPPVENAQLPCPIAPIQTLPCPIAPTTAVAVEDAGQDQLGAILKELAPLLRQNRFSDAEKLLEEKLRDPALAAISERLHGEKSDLAEIRALRRSALDALRAKGGSTVTLTMRGAKITGAVKNDPNRTDLTLALRDGLELTMKADQLDAQDVDAYAPVETGDAKAKDQRRRGLLFLAAGDTAKAEEYFTKARDSGLGNALDPYLGRIAALRLDGREAVALDAWKKAEGLFANKNWKAATQAYEIFQRDHARSAALASNAEMLKKRLESIDDALGPPREISLDLGGGVKMELELILAGEFEMGSNDGESNEKPVHNVKISRPFYMGKYVVTQSQFEKVAGKSPSHFKGENLPVDSVSYSDAEEFCTKANKLTGKPFRLPTEAEWEYACRAGTKTKYNSGDDDKGLEQGGWFKNNSEDTTHPVGQKKPNAWGLYDMYGNVWQWCQDWYEEDYYGKSGAEDPQGPVNRGNRVIRGGCWMYNSEFCRSALRFGYGDARVDHIGFRVVMASASRTP